MIIGLFALISKAASDITVTCDFGYPFEWEKIGEVYTCSVQNFSVAVPNENVTNVIGVHEEGKTNKDVKKLNIASQYCEFIPRGFENFFPNLEGLRVAQSRLVSLTQYDLKVWPMLRNCDMFNNYLRFLDSDLFEKTPHVEYLYFGDNQLSSIGYDVFQPLKKLSKAVFQGNVCVRKNANYPEEVESLQKTINDNCSPKSARVSEAAAKIRVLEEIRRKDDEVIRQKLVENHKLEMEIKELHESSSTFWIFGILFLFTLAASAVFYVMKYQRSYLDRFLRYVEKRGGVEGDMESFFQQEEMVPEPAEPHGNGGLKLSFTPQTLSSN